MYRVSLGKNTSECLQTGYFKIKPVCRQVRACSINQLYLTLCDPMDYSWPGSSVHGILQVRILEWVAIPFCRGSSQPRDQTWSPALQADSLPSELQSLTYHTVGVFLIDSLKVIGLRINPSSSKNIF